LRVQIADRLRRAIVTGRMRPGTVLVETALAEQMNVSRAPIREAIALLENDGLVETAAYKGKRVKPLTVREVEEIWSLRQTFEVMAVRRILDRGRTSPPLWEPCHAMQAAAEADDREALILGDEQFHRTLIALADHQLLLQSWTALYLRIHQIMALRNRRDSDDLAEIAGNHPPSCRRFRRDTRTAVRLISEHTRALRDFDPASIVDLQNDARATVTGAGGFVGGQIAAGLLPRRLAG
jgi:DNA-binding GntR family transcriptional regulator